MYPHAPPVITRVSRDVIPNNENVAYNSLNSNSYNNHFHNNNNNHFSNTVNMNTSMGGIPDGAMVNSSYIQNCWSNEGAMGRTSAAMVASSVMQSQVEPPVPEQVWIQSLPPMRSTCDGSSLSSSSSSGAVPQSRGEDSFEFGSGIGLNNNVCETSAGVGFGSEGVEGHNVLEIDAATSIYNAWSPISSLGDLLDFLIGIPARRREWWSSGHNRQRHQQQLRFLRSGNGGVEGGGPLSTSVRLVPTASNASNTVQNVWSEPNNAMPSSPQHLLRHHCHTKQPPFPSSSCDMDHDGEDDNLMMMDDCKHDCDGMISSPKKRVNPLATNRFDVGYDRGAMIHRWGVRY